MRRDAVNWNMRPSLMAAAARRRDEMGLPVPVIRKSAVDSLVARVAESTTDRVHAAWADGMLTSFDDVVSMAIAEVGQLTSTVREAPPAVLGDSYELSIRGDAWATSLREGLVGVVSQPTAQSLMSRYASAFPPEYWLTRSAEAAIADIQLIENRGGRIGARLDRSDEGADGFLRLKIVDATDIALADVLPILDNAGLRVLDEHPYRVRLADAEPVWLHDLRLTCVDSAAATADRVDVPALRGSVRRSLGWRRRERPIQPARFGCWRKQARRDYLARLRPLPEADRKRVQPGTHSTDARRAPDDRGGLDLDV